MQEESIYNLVPKEYVPPPKDERYKSKYPANLPPTSSTLCHKTTSKPGVRSHMIQVGNMAGKLADDPSAHTSYGETKTMGHLKGTHSFTKGNVSPNLTSSDSRTREPWAATSCQRVRLI